MEEEVLEELLEAEEVLEQLLVLQLEVVLVLVQVVLEVLHMPVHKELVLVCTQHFQVGNAYVAWEESWLLL